MAREYVYKGKEIAGYIQKNPAVMTRYLTEKGGLRERGGKGDREDKKGRYQ